MKETKENMTEVSTDKLTDRTFTQSLVMSVFGILICIVALCSATFAWFNADISSSSNNIQAASCEITVSVFNDGNDVTDASGQYLFEGGKAYDITVKATGTAKSVYCILNIGGVDRYTEQIAVTPDGTATRSAPDDFTFTLKFTNDTMVRIITRWGISSLDERDFADNKYYLDLNEVNGSTLETPGDESTPETPVDESTPETPVDESTPETPESSDAPESSGADSPESAPMETGE